MFIFLTLSPMLICLFSLFLLIAYSTELHKNIYQNLAIKYRKIQALNSLVSTQYKNIFMILWISFCLIGKTFYIQLCQKFNKTIRKVDKNLYEVCYVINGVYYTMIVKPKRGPRSVIEVVDEDDNDLTSELISYLGPSENFHGYELTPKYFKAKKMTFSMASGEEVNFDEDEVLRV